MNTLLTIIQEDRHKESKKYFEEELQKTCIRHADASME